MTPPENGKPLWNEAQVAVLLEEFFQREMPADLRNESPELLPRARALPVKRASSEPLRNPARSKEPRPRSIAGVVMVGFSSLLMVLVALIYWNDPSPKSPDEGPGNVAGPNESESRDDGEFDPLGPNDQGPVEKRSRIHSVRQGDPGGAIEFPELDIEVFPLDPNAPSSEDEGKHRLPEEKSSDPKSTPMPEEGRHLPESRLPEPNDPDEADDLPLLPELQAEPIEFF